MVVSVLAWLCARSLLWVQEFIFVPYIAPDEFKPAFISKRLVARANASLVFFLFLFLRKEDCRWGLAGITGSWEPSGKTAGALHPTEQPKGKKKKKEEKPVYWRIEIG